MGMLKIVPECSSTSPPVETCPTLKTKKPVPIWWMNAIFFPALHVFGLVGAIWISPWATVKPQTLWMVFLSWQMAGFGIVIGYHRLFCHHAFVASLPLRIALAFMGTNGSQGSIKWWVLRHRLHHRFTDDPEHDPYAASLGLLYSHMGWIFWKPNYDRLVLVEKGDLERDPVVRFQHKYYLPLAVLVGFVLPTVIAATWGDALGGFIWGGVIARLIIWHNTFAINSFAHWEGLGTQPHSRDIPDPLDWDPPKWIIWLLWKYTPLISSIKVTAEPEILKARAKMLDLEAEELSCTEEAQKDALRKKAADLRAMVPLEAWGISEDKLERWTRKELQNYVENGRRKVLLIDGCVVDITTYMKDHPGGAALMTRFLALPTSDNLVLPLTDATVAFHGGFNNHSSAGKEKMKVMRVARLVD
ncbi:hypothetical protein CALCODRAFT_548885 [Calocera cornea HHB12733]|uniref:Cytochrome b5 heme-binding domain-containing protein n=1 Tax=Calocera cornea HHB12733 TaxID=1353952 RepID=A0A165K4J9_9BASI|nr:hypothetical protein CALCODRAFT_548885 [Calocera cornea HHB12733]